MRVQPAKLTPKAVDRPDFAMRLTEDLIADAGKWLLAFGDRIQILDHDEVVKTYDMNGANRPPPKGAHYGTAISVQGLRVLAALERAGGVDRRAKDIGRYLNAKDRGQVSPRIGHFPLCLQRGASSSGRWCAVLSRPEQGMPALSLAQIR